MKLSKPKLGRMNGPIFRIELAPATDRIVVSMGESATVVDAKTRRDLRALPKGATFGSIDPQGERMVVTLEGKTRGGRYQWDEELWDLEGGKRIATLASNYPDDKLMQIHLGRMHVYAVRFQRGKGKPKQSILRFDRDGRREIEWPLPSSDLVFRFAVTEDERRAAHVYFTAKGGLFDLERGKGSKLAGGTLNIGRHHEKGVRALSFDASGTRLLATSHGGTRATIWDVAKGKALSGPWTKLPMTDAFFVGDALCLSHASDATLRVLSVANGGPEGALKMGEGPARFVALGDGRHVACLGRGGTIEIWDVSSRKRLAKAASGLKEASAFAASADMLAVGDRKGALVVLAIG